MSKRLHYLYGWIFVRPRRWFFWKCILNSKLRLTPKKDWDRWLMPNPHWWILYKTVFTLCKWFYWDAWRYFCTYKNGFLHKKPLIARIIHRIGSTTAGFAISGFECFHCGSPDGNQVELSEDETGELFRLERTWTTYCEDGTDYRFSGTTVCPKCGFESYYEDGTL